MGRCLPIAALVLALAGCGGDTSSADPGPADPGPADHPAAAPDDGAVAGEDAVDARETAGPDVPADLPADLPADTWTDLPADTPPDTPDAGPPPIASRSFDPPEPWAKPIEDYLAKGFETAGSWDFQRGLHDLHVHDGRLYLSYGDADRNLGRVFPTEIRAFASAQDPAPQAEFTTAQEALYRYRTVGDALVAPGLDTTEPGLWGYVYHRALDDDGWTASTKLDKAIHVADAAGFAGALWASGSGATQAEWDAGTAAAHLWKSVDGGHTFTIAAQEPNGDIGDARWIRMLPLGESLLLFGYKTNSKGEVNRIANGAWDGEAYTRFPDTHALWSVFVEETDVLPDGTGLVRGIDTALEPLVYQAWHVVPFQGAVLLDRFAGRRIVDVFVNAPTGETLFLTVAGDAYPAAGTASWDVRIEATKDLETFTELVAFTTDVPPACIAWWADGLYYGTDHGEAWRSLPL